MAHMEILTMQLKDTFQSMRQEALVNDTFMSLYSLKEKIEDKFFMDLVPTFCSEAKNDIKLLAQIVTGGGVLNYNLMKDYVCKVKGGSLSMGTCRLTNALTHFQGAIDAASMEQCKKALNQVQHEFSVLEEKLHICLQIERRIVLLAVNGSSSP